MTLRIRSDGTTRGTELWWNGVYLDAVKSVTWEADTFGLHARATVELHLTEVRVSSGEVCWVGLDAVPADVLADELRRRRQETS